VDNVRIDISQVQTHIGPGLRVLVKKTKPGRGLAIVSIEFFSEIRGRVFAFTDRADDVLPSDILAWIEQFTNAQHVLSRRQQSRK
jgi:hypothetical protein